MSPRPSLITVLAISIGFVACSSTPQNAEVKQTSEIPSISKTTPDHSHDVSFQKSLIPIPHKSASTTSHHEVSSQVPPEKALGWLMNGNKRYLNNKLRKDGQSLHDIQTLAKGQHPHTVVLSCSDSRVPPELIFDQKLGEIFVVRTAGESLDQAGIASIEYAISHLGPSLVVVMGHTSCGAVKASLETPENVDAGSPSLNALVKDIKPRLYSGKNTDSRAPASEYLAVESWNNATGVAQDLLQRSEILRKKVEEGKVKVVPALYSIQTGKVDF